MAKRVNYWLCQGCGFRNERANVKCRGEGCKRTRPKKRVPKHAEVLRDKPYEAGWPELSVEIHGGQLHACGCCGRAPTRVKRHDRDHDHRTGNARGVACSYCNRERLRGIVNAEEARWVLAYFERVERYYHQTEGGKDEDGRAVDGPRPGSSGAAATVDGELGD